VIWIVTAIAIVCHIWSGSRIRQLSIEKADLQAELDAVRLALDTPPLVQAPDRPDPAEDSGALPRTRAGPRPAAIVTSLSGSQYWMN
jgi:hypothetical protein